MEKMTDRTEKAAKKLLTLLGVTPTKLSAEEDEEKNIKLSVEVAEEESGLLIGYHGETLSAFQYLLSQIVNKGNEVWAKIQVDMNKYRDQREQELKQMATNAADRALQTGDEIEMPFLTPGERRIIHMELADRQDITTFSDGEGKSRRLIVAPKK